MTKTDILEKAKNFDKIVAVGDVHGKTKELGFRIKERYKIEDSIIILCGDIGFGFHKPAHHKAEFDNINRICKKLNNLVFIIRGNHDDPDYFNGKKTCGEWSNVILIPDYTVIETKNFRSLCVGGGISIDRIIRKQGESYWKDEIPIYNEKRLKEIENIDFVFTHASPNFCDPVLKDGIKGWLKQDWQLEVDCDDEREVFTKIFNYFSSNNNIIKWWVYGHYHLSRTQKCGDTKFRAIDELEFFEIPIESN